MILCQSGGGTLAHEAEHFFAQVEDPVPYERVDNPERIAFKAAGREKVEGCCDRFSSKWPYRLRIRQYACECDIDMGK